MFEEFIDKIIAVKINENNIKHSISPEEPTINKILSKFHKLKRSIIDLRIRFLLPNNYFDDSIDRDRVNIDIEKREDEFKITNVWYG